MDLEYTIYIFDIIQPVVRILTEVLNLVGARRGV